MSILLRLCVWRAGAGRGLLLLVLLLGVAACTSAPPRKPSPTLGERQREGLRALGFQQSEEDWHLILPKPICFEFASADIRADAARSATDTAQELLRLGIHGVRLDGHSDNVGPPAVNLDLSRRRAEAVGRLFIAAGFADAAVVRHGHGASLPVADNDSASGRARNRRVELIVPADALAP
ncbi:MAG: OmpA family protein [Dokdonella sp.]